MIEFLQFMDELRVRFPCHLEIYYSKIMDWCIDIRKYDCVSDFPDSAHIGRDVIMCKVSDTDMELAFAKAYVAVKEWLRENMGGY